jgi:hypothetical protein
MDTEPVQARPRPEKDSSSESENSAADGDTHDDEYDDFRPNNARTAHVLVQLGCNLSEKEVWWPLMSCCMCLPYFSVSVLDCIRISAA